MIMDVVAMMRHDRPFNRLLVLDSCTVYGLRCAVCGVRCAVCGKKVNSTAPDTTIQL